MSADKQAVARILQDGCVPTGSFIFFVEGPFHPGGAERFPVSGKIKPVRNDRRGRRRTLPRELRKER